MKKSTFLVTLMLMLAFAKVNAQSKVFKEISEDIKSSTFTITQEKAVVGYLVFTQLEKASADSFNYKLTIMDENLNDIGKVAFKDYELKLQSVAFENDILALAFLKIKRTTDKKRGQDQGYVQLHFLNLDGKTINKQIIDLPSVEKKNSYSYWDQVNDFKGLKSAIQIIAAKDKGFTCLYSDINTYNLSFYNFSGNKQWAKNITINTGGYTQVAKDNIYIISGGNSNAKGERIYKVNAYSCTDGKNGVEYELTDKFRNNLSVTSFSPDPQTGNLCISGRVVKKNMSDASVTNFYSNKNYLGVYTLTFNGETKKDIKETFSYWNDNSSQPLIKSNGKINELNGYHTLAVSFRDFNGNTYFAGNILNRRPRIINNLISPLLVFYPLLLKGFNKFKNYDGCVLKQDVNGKLSIANNIPLRKQNFTMGKVLYDNYYNDRRYYPISNSTNNNNYLIVDDKKYVTIFDVTNNKVLKKINHKEDRSTTIEVSGAKEGHIMVIEYNKKEKTTKLSIEAL